MADEKVNVRPSGSSRFLACGGARGRPSRERRQHRENLEDVAQRMNVSNEDIRLKKKGKERGTSASGFQSLF